MSTNLRFLDTRIIPGQKIVVVGGRAAGKTTLACDLLSHLRGKVFHGIAMTPTGEGKKVLSVYLPTEQPSADRLSKFLDLVEEADVDAVVVLDDVGYDLQFMRSDALKRAFRQKKVTLVVCVSEVLQLDPVSRNMIDRLFMLRGADKYRRQLFSHFFSGVDRVALEKIFDEATKDYGCLTAYIGLAKMALSSLKWYTSPATPAKFPVVPPINKSLLAFYDGLTEEDAADCCEVTRLGPDGEPWVSV